MKYKLTITILFIILIVSSYISRDIYIHTFTTEKWLNDPYGRVNIVDDMLDRYSLVGMSESEINKLLGDETKNAYFKEDDNIVYWLGPERGLVSIDSEWLVITFEKGTVSKYEILRD